MEHVLISRHKHNLERIEWRNKTFLISQGQNQNYRVIGNLEEERGEELIYTPVPIRLQRKLRAFLRGSREGSFLYTNARITFDENPFDKLRSREKRRFTDWRGGKIPHRYNRDTREFERV